MNELTFLPSFSEEDATHLQPIPQLLEVNDHQQGRSTLSGLFKPKYRDCPRNNVHRNSERGHKEVVDCGTSRHKLYSYSRESVDSSTDTGRLRRTPFPGSSTTSHSPTRPERPSSPHMSHNRYLPRERGRKSPRPIQETEFNGECDPDN